MPELFFIALPFFYFQLVASITPGPNNVMLTASGMNFGYQRTLPHIAGVVAGNMVLLAICALGIGSLYETLPQVQIGLKILGSAYLLYLAFKILKAGRLGLHEKAEQAVKPFSFIEATLFQFVNPKAVIFAMAAVSIVPAELAMEQRLIAILASTLFNCILSTHVWAIFGAIIARLFRDDKTRAMINIALAVLLIATIPMMWF